MRVLGLTFVRNAEAHLQDAMDSMASYCDTVCTIDDRSTDRTGDILRAHPAVSNVFIVDPVVSHEPWHFPESWLLNALYRMADFYSPDWVVMLSADERIDPADRVRERLEAASPEVSGVRMHLISAWNDPDYPHMVPVMGQGRALVCRVWRYRPGLIASGKRLHNHYSPVNLLDFGRLEYLPDLHIAHSGWSTLAERIAKVDLYSSLDPHLELNEGVPYDVGLLFGYERDRIDELIQEYERRVALIRDPRAGS